MSALLPSLGLLWLEMAGSKLTGEVPLTLTKSFDSLAVDFQGSVRQTSGHFFPFFPPTPFFLTQNAYCFTEEGKKNKPLSSNSDERTDFSCMLTLAPVRGTRLGWRKEQRGEC